MKSVQLKYLKAFIFLVSCSTALSCHGTIKASGITADEKRIILQEHNRLRQLVATGGFPGQPAAENMQEIVWDDELAARAQEWANNCEFRHDPNRTISNDYECCFSRRFLFEKWLEMRENNSTCVTQANQILEGIKCSWFDKGEEDVKFEPLYDRILMVFQKLTEFWKKSKARKNCLIRSHSAWLDKSETVSLSVAEENNASTSSASQQRGRPRKTFQECSARTKRRRLAEISMTDDSIATALRETSTKSDIEDGKDLPVTCSEVLSLFVEAKLTKNQYLLIQNFVNTKIKKNGLPSYKAIQKEKESCYPEAEKLTVTETSAETDLQALLDHTATRLLISQKDVLETLSKETSKSLQLEGKWGFDGSTGQSEYKQNFLESDAKDCDLFVTSYGPLQLQLKNDTEEIIIWKNPRPASTRYCRPMRFQFKKETAAVSVSEEQYFLEKINSLQPLTVMIADVEWSVNYSLHLTMVDGKVCNALNDSTSLKCYICGATPKEMNNIDLCLQKVVNTNSFSFGLSPLHAWIRFFEFFVHISYRLTFKKWQVRGDDKLELENKKKSVQAQFREKLGLIVDRPKPGGSGSSNDGNTARTFFKNPKIAAEITGIDQMLIDRCATILQVLNSGFNIEADKFKVFALETAEQIIKTYPWYYLPASVHKVLLHGASVIEHHGLISIGELSEEAAESRNKDIKNYRLHHTRKMSRIVTNNDLFKRLLLTSDPLISNLRKLTNKKNLSYLNLH